MDSGSGPTTVEPSFAFGNPDCGILPVDVNPTGALGPASAVGALEEALCEVVPCGGVLHVPFELLSYLYRFRLIREVNGSYVTAGGIKVVGGCGYPGTGPANAPASAGEAWLFATGPLVLVQSPLFFTPDKFAESVDRNLNNVTVRAEKFFAVGFSCTLFAVRIDISIC